MGLLNWFINPYWKLKTHSIAHSISNVALRRRVERAFLLKDSETNRRLMKEINNEAEKEKGVKKKVGLQEKNKVSVWPQGNCSC